MVQDLGRVLLSLGGDYMFFNSLLSSYNEYHNNVYEFWQAIQNISLEIPEQIYIVLESLTNVVGYVMPLKLYTPIISCILLYWLILVTGYAYKASLSIASSLSGFFKGLKG